MRFYTVYTASGFSVVPGDGFYTDDVGDLVIFVGETTVAQIKTDQWEGISPYLEALASVKHAGIVEHSVADVVQPPSRTGSIQTVDVVPPGFLSPEVQDAADIDGMLKLPPSGAIPIVTEPGLGFDPTVVPHEHVKDTPVFDEVLAAGSGDDDDDDDKEE